MDENPIRHQFEKEPPSALFDPMDEARWTLPMTCAWLIWRKMDRVRDFWDKFQAERVVSRPVMTTETVRAEGLPATTNITVHGLEPREAAKPTLDRVGLTLVLEPYLGNTVEHLPFFSGLDACLEEIFESAKHGRITVSGLSEEANTRSIISAEDFEDLEIWPSSKDGEGILRYCHGKKKGEAAYSHLLFEPRVIVKVWPAADIPTSTSRADILLRVRRGEITTKEAEFQAIAQGFGPLAHMPPDAEYDPFKQEVWTLEMTLAWIMRRTADSVLRYWPEYQSNVWTWEEALDVEERGGRKSWIKGFELKQGRPSAFTLQHSVALEDAGRADGRITSPRALHDYEGARTELFAKLSRGEIIGTARIEGSTGRFDLRPVEWEDIHIPLVTPGNDRLRLFRAKSRVELLEVRLPSAKVVEFWPSLNPLPSSLEKAASQVSIIERIRKYGGVSSLSPTEQQIWDAIQAAGGEDALPNRPRDYIKRIQDHAKGVAPSRSSIDRFFGRFRNTDDQA